MKLQIIEGTQVTIYSIVYNLKKAKKLIFAWKKTLTQISMKIIPFT